MKFGWYLFFIVANATEFCHTLSTHTSRKQAKNIFLFMQSQNDVSEMKMENFAPNSLRRHSVNNLLYSFAGAGFIVTTMAKISFGASDDLSAIPILYDGKTFPLKDYLGSKCSLIVNVASQCALTSQYEELVDLYNEFHSQGFNILAFPCNQFGSQEPAPVERIRRDMLNQFGVEFPIFDKIDVNGPGVSPLYARLKSYSDIGVTNINKISWNFEKFLVNSSGTPLRRYKPGIRPAQLSSDVKSLIATGVVPARKKVVLNDYE